MTIKMEKLKKALRNLLIEYRSINTDGGVLVYDGEDDATTGTSVYIVDEEGNRSVPEDKEYVDEEKTIYKVENGIITEITPVQEQDDEQPEEQPEAPAEEPVEETPEEPAEEPVEEQPVDEPAEEEPIEEPVEEPAEEPVETPVEEVEEVREEANDLAEQIQALNERINALVEEVEALKAFKKTVEEMSAGKPAQQQFREVSIDPNRSNNKELANLQKLFN